MSKKTVSILSGVVVTTLGMCGLYRVFNNIEPPEYSWKWFEKLTNVEWEKEREKVQRIVMSPKYSDDMREEARKLLNVFDIIKRKKEGTGFKDYRFPVHGEHGTNLYKK